MSIKLIIIISIILIIFLIIRLILDKNLILYFSNNLEIEPTQYRYIYLKENTINLNKLYNFPRNFITLILINYLFLTLVIIVKITNNFSGPLRNNN